MSKQYIIGLDGGSQSTKVLIFDLRGNVICEGRESLRPMHLADPAIVEHPEDDLWDSIVGACRQALKNFGGNISDIIGIGLCTIRFCRVLLREDGTLAQPVMSWMDARVSKAHEDTNPLVRYITTTSGYITHRLTGQFNDTAANYQGVWPIDTDTWQWSQDTQAYVACNMPREMLFELKMPGEILGYVTEKASRITGLPGGIPVVATANDKAVEALGAGLIHEKTALVSLGTYITAMVKGCENRKGTAQFWTNFAAVPKNYLYESSGIRRGMWTVSWFKDLLGKELLVSAKEQKVSPEEYLNQEAQKVPAGSNGLMTVLDWLAPTNTPFKKGMMIGFDGRHTRAHIYRSILEAIALTMKTHVDNMLCELGIELENIIVSGGGSHSDLLMQIFADVFAIPVARNVVNGSASLGSAISVAVATDVYKDYAEAIKHMVKVSNHFFPDEENTIIYKKLNNIYRTVTSHTDELLRESYKIFK